MSSSPYAPAAKLLNQIWTQRKGLKTVAYNRQGDLVCSKTTYAQCAHVLQRKPVLDQLLKSVEISAKNEGLLYVLLYELIFGPNKKIRGGGALKQLIVAAEARLRQELERIRVEGGDASNSSASCQVTIPRYVRINTLQITTEQVIKLLKTKEDNIFVDAHVPDLIVMPPTPETRAALQDLVTSQQVILQDKSSCFSALCLVHGFETRLTGIGYIDACAAPGNKTSHLASLISNDKSTIHALDKSKDRFEMLQRRMKELVGGKAVHCHNLDFFETQSNGKNEQGHNFDNIQAIMLDPSCSGSGMKDNHQEATRDPEFVNDRVQSLSDFQLQALKHATSADKFPQVERVVYSTCSLYIQENEGVVQRFLQEHGNEWTLVSPMCLKSWKRRGIKVNGLTEEQVDAMIRVHPDYDASNGFFVACFEKVVQAKRKKRQVHEWRGVSSVAGITIYHNSFDWLQEQDSDVNGQKKRKLSEPATKIIIEGSKSSMGDKVGQVEKNDSAVESTAHSKKIAKKLEWRRKQREQKDTRLLSEEESMKHLV